MDKTFIDILQKLISEQGKEALLNESKCKTLLPDYTKNEFKKESRLLFQAHKAGALKTINTTQELANCKLRQISLLHEDYGLDEKLAIDIVNALALVLRGDTAGEETQAAYECEMKQRKNRDNVKAAGPVQNSFNDYINSGYTCIEKGDYDKAIIEFDKAAIELKPDDATGHMILGVSYNDFSGSYMESLKSRRATGKEFKEVIENHEKAAEYFKKTLNLEPDNNMVKELLQLIPKQLEVARRYIKARAAIENGREKTLQIMQSLKDKGILK